MHGDGVDEEKMSQSDPEREAGPDLMPRSKQRAGNRSGRLPARKSSMSTRVGGGLGRSP